MSEAEKKNLLLELDKKVDAMPDKTLAWLDGFMTGAIRATAEKRNEEQKEGA